VASPNCYPADPRRNKDLEELFPEGPGHRFEPDDASGPASPDMDEDEMMRAMRDEAVRPTFTDKAGGMAHLGRFLRPTNGMLKDLQEATGIPFWTWYRHVELGREAAEKFLAEPSFTLLPQVFKGFKRSEEEMVQILMEARHTPRYDELAKQYGEKVATAEGKLWGLYTDYFAKAGLSPEDVGELVTDVIPNIRKKGGDFRGYTATRGHIPKIGKVLDKALRTGEINTARELNARVIAKQVFRAVATEQFMAPHWNLAVSQFKQLAKDMPAPLADIFHRYLGEARHVPDPFQVGLSNSYKATVAKLSENKLFKKLGLANHLSKDETLDLVGFFTGLNYQLNLGWNIGAIIRQYMQPLQTVAPILGINSMMRGKKAAIKWLRDESLQKFYEQRGVVTRDIQHERFRDINEAMSKFRPEGIAGKAKEALDFFREKGTVYFKKGDDFNRVVAYASMAEHATPWAEKFVKGQVDWSTFLQRSKLDMLDVENGPLVQIVKKAMEAGRVDEAVHEMAREFTRNTQFIYSRGNNPYFMQSTMGRFLGQYGTWPVQYVEFMRNMFTRGSYRNRLESFARWTAVNSAIVYGAGQAFGVEMSRWSFFAPMSYQGGPFMEMTIQGASTVGLASTGSLDLKKSLQKGTFVADSGEGVDPVDRINAARFGQNLVTQTPPSLA
jgi:hypothetical protein